MSRSKGLVPTKRYQSSSTHCSEVLAKLKLKKKRVKLQSQGHSVKNNGTH